MHQLHPTLLRIVHAYTLISGVILLLITLITSLNAMAFGAHKIAQMYGSSFPALSGYEDFVRLAISAAALMFLPYCQLQFGHIKIDLLEKKFSQKLNQYLDLLWILILFFTVLFLLYFMFFGLVESRSDGVISSVLGWSEWFFYIPGMLSLSLWCSVLVGQFIFLYKEVRV